MTKVLSLLILLVFVSFFTIAQEPVRDSILNAVDTEAAFPGGSGGWRNYLVNTLDATVPIDKGAPAGTYRVMIRFIVKDDGTVSDVFAETSHGYGMEKESIRVIEKGPDWIPAILNGKNVTAYRRQPITFVIQEEEGKKRRRD